MYVFVFFIFMKFLIILKYGEIIPSITTSSKSTVIENIKQLYGAAISSELLPFSLNSQDYMFQAKGFFTSVSYSAKKTTFLLFINRRYILYMNIVNNYKCRQIS